MRKGKKVVRLTVGAVLAACLFLALAGCATLTEDQKAAFLAGIPVSTPKLASIPDGVYSGSYTIALPPGAAAAFRSLAVEVTMASGRIMAVAIVSPKQLATGDFYDTIVAGPAGVIARQTLAVDGVTGASYSSRAFLKAAEKALSK